ncbi:Uncharacterized conserved protein, DUF1697 family [Duganella sp. CF458]|uniref:DUF1697 domain-containing protein n=1 Tax=Duganella sp. CF458 TaxID=1884368 RepID=UPI0008E7C052|nr:DUF1697 domain-containing protein [Duganella sp. CF458]SFF75960.1 Uncharacterized conserved protein, DUF1697 family [Duganella sp. CF458]
MPRYIALLRGVSPMNCKMPELKAAFESAGFSNVKTLLSSGNVAFDARSATEAALARKAEAAMEKALGRSFYTIVRPQQHLLDLLADDPYPGLGADPGAKRVVSFMRAAPPDTVLPPPVSGAQMLGIIGSEVFSTYLPSSDGPVFMRLIEKTFGKDITTRTWDTVRKCAAA